MAFEYTIIADHPLHGKFPGFSFGEPIGRGPIEVRVAQNVRRYKYDPYTLLISRWITHSKYPKNQFKEACRLAMQLNEDLEVPVEVVTKGKRNTVVVMAKAMDFILKPTHGREH